MKQIMFITLASQDEIASYAINPNNGEINETSRLHVSGRPAPLTVDIKTVSYTHLTLPTIYSV